MRTLLVFLFAAALLVTGLFSSAAIAVAQENPSKENPPKAATTAANPLSTWTKLANARVDDLLLRSAEKVPEEYYGFKPTEAVRSFGQIIGHLADAQYLFCSVALDEKNPAPGIEKSKTSKADLIAALKEAFAYCNKAYDGLTDASAIQTVKLFGNDAPRLAALTVNNMHNMEHYGNLVTYMRLKNIVPPSSEPRPQPEAQPKKQ